MNKQQVPPQIGHPAWLASIGTECGTCMHIREIVLVSRNAASWTWKELGSMYNHTTFDKNGERRIFGSKAEGLKWMTEVQEGRVHAARAVLRSRELVLAEWLSRLQEYGNVSED